MHATTAEAVTGWPSLPLARWAPTRDTLLLWTQVVGKVRLARTPLRNHWWNVPLYVTARGLTSSLLWADDGRGFQLDFDFVDHRLDLAVSDGRRRHVALEPKSVADFHAEVMARLDELELATPIWTMPVEVPDAVPFEVDHDHATYDRELVERFWRLLVRTAEVLNRFQATYVGKASPVHVFWGALDLAVTRFSGREAPPHPGGAPHCGPHVMREAYSHEVSSAGYWPGPPSGGGNLDGEGIFYAYAYPEPDGYREAAVPEPAWYDPGLGEWVLPYEVVRQAPDPAAVLLAFLQATWEAAATTGGWDRARLERPLPPWAHP